MMNARTIAIAALALGSLGFVAGCSDDDDDGDVCGGTPTVTIASPAEGSLVTPDDQFVLELENFEIADFTEVLEAADCQGHFHFFIREPGEEPPGTYINPPLQSTTFTLDELFARSADTGDVPSGSHIIRIQLHNHDHTIVEGANHAETTIKLLVE